MRKLTLLIGLFLVVEATVVAQHSVARQWNEVLLEAIRNDFARPTVHARNLFHTSIAMYDAWAAYDTLARPFLLGNTLGNYTSEFNGVPMPTDVNAAREEAISYAVYRLIKHRFERSPGYGDIHAALDSLFNKLGYNKDFLRTDYSSGSPAALGNYIAKSIIDFGLQDGSNEQNNYANTYYAPMNEALLMNQPGNPTLTNPDHWQPLALSLFIDQSGQVLANTPPFLSPEWGQVVPFALSADDLTVYERGGNAYWVYHDPGNPPYLKPDDPKALPEEYKWNFSLVSIWSSHLDPSDGVIWDISPGAIGGIASYPAALADYPDFYDLWNGGDPSLGHAINPYTGQPYAPQMVPRADYARVLAEFWADGPDSETPPGHWFTILNYVNDHAAFSRRFRGKGAVLDALEWDVKAYFMLGGAMHDAAVTAWGIKGYYDFIRPVSAIRYMGDKGQSSDPDLPSYDPEGFELIPGFIELVMSGDPLAGNHDEHVGKIKLYAWRGPEFIADPAVDEAGVGWILAENWWPYQRPTFVTPPFAGYVSGHSTFSRAAAEVMTLLTGDEFFPGGMGEFHAPKNEFLVFEEGPSVDVTLQWATYRDASDQTSLSRIWGGIHPPADDIRGRLIGEKIGVEAFHYAETFFFVDEDKDGFFSFEDCNDKNAAIHPAAKELCDGIDNNCNGLVDEGLPLMIYFKDEDMDGFGNPILALDTCVTTPPPGYVSNGADCNDTDPNINPIQSADCDPIASHCGTDMIITRFFVDLDQDNFGDPNQFMDTCLIAPPKGYVTNNLDCDDDNPAIHPAAKEVCDGIDNDCNGLIDEGMIFENFYLDTDQDGFGDPTQVIESCLDGPPPGYVRNNTDCDDSNSQINPDAVDFPDNGLDDDCSGTDLFQQFKVFPNPTKGEITIHFEYTGEVQLQLFDYSGRLVLKRQLRIIDNSVTTTLREVSPGMYILQLLKDGERLVWGKVVRF
ncbi:MAG: MopE-related protein [Saprospiraceae bacterium]